MSKIFKLSRYALAITLSTLSLTYAQLGPLPPLWKNTLVITPSMLAPIVSEPANDPLLGLHDNGVTAPVYEIIH